MVAKNSVKKNNLDLKKYIENIHDFRILKIAKEMQHILSFLKYYLIQLISRMYYWFQR